MARAGAASAGGVASRARTAAATAACVAAGRSGRPLLTDGAAPPALALRAQIWRVCHRVAGPAEVGWQDPRRQKDRGAGCVPCVDAARRACAHGDGPAARCVSRRACRGAGGVSGCAPWRSPASAARVHRRGACAAVRVHSFCSSAASTVMRRVCGVFPGRYVQCENFDDANQALTEGKMLLELGETQLEQRTNARRHSTRCARQALICVCVCLCVWLCAPDHNHVIKYYDFFLHQEKGGGAPRGLKLPLCVRIPLTCSWCRSRPMQRTSSIFDTNFCMTIYDTDFFVRPRV